LEKVLPRMKIGDVAGFCEHKRLAAAASKEVGRMMRGCAGRVLATWILQTMEVRRVRAMLERVALRIVNAGMYCGWATWEGNMNELRRQQYMLEKLALRIHNSLLSKIWKSWIFSYNTREKEISRYWIHSVEVMGELIHSKNCGLITSAFAQWNRHGAEAVHLAPTRSKIARRWRQSEIRTSFEQWLETMHRNNVVLKVAEKVIIR